MDPYALTCPCSCHGRGMYAPCDWDGGCGHLHAPEVDTQDPHRRRCARAGDCPGHQRITYEDGTVERIGAPLEAERGMCRPCQDTVARTIGGLETDLWGLYAELGATINAGFQQDVVGGTRELPIPIRTSVRDLAARIVTVAVTWAEPIAEQARIGWDSCLIHDYTRPHAALTKAAGVLRWNVARLLDHQPIEVRAFADNGWAGFDWQDGCDAALELLDLHRRAQQILGLTEKRHRLPAPCPRCETMSLVRDDGAEDVYCARCAAGWSDLDYTEMTVVLANDYSVGA